MPTEVKLTPTTVGSKQIVSRLWKAEADHCEGSGQTPEDALRSLKECHELFAPNASHDFVLPKKFYKMQKKAA